MVIAEIPKRKSKSEELQKMNLSAEFELRHINANFENISFFTKMEMTKSQHESVQLCHNDTFCCEAAYTISNNQSDTRYVLLAYDGLRPNAIPGTYWHIQMCGVVMCHPKENNDDRGCKIPNLGEYEG